MQGSLLHTHRRSWGLLALLPLLLPLLRVRAYLSTSPRAHQLSNPLPVAWEAAHALFEARVLLVRPPPPVDSAAAAAVAAAAAADAVPLDL